MFISQNGMVQRTSVRGINRYGRASQGVRVMNLREDDQVSAVALVMESDTSDRGAVVGDDPAGDGALDEGALDDQALAADEVDAAEAQDSSLGEEPTDDEGEEPADADDTPADADDTPADADDTPADGD